MLRKSSSGFSLIETLAALAILLISVLGVYRLQLFTSEKIHFAYSAGQIYELGLEASRRVSHNAERLANYMDVKIENVANVHCNPCNPSQLAILDLYHLKLSLEQVESASALIKQCIGIDAICLTTSWGNTDLKDCDQSDQCIEQVIYYFP